MGLADLIQRKRTATVLCPATAIHAIPAIPAPFPADIPPTIATIATIAVATHGTDLDLWRWFVVEADRVYRSSPKAADSWERHKGHRATAQEHCTAGDISAARAELEKALTALQGATITQPDLLTT